MHNVVLQSFSTFQCKHRDPIKVIYQVSANMLVLIDFSYQIYFYELDLIKNKVHLLTKNTLIQQLSHTKVVLLAYMVQQQKALIVTEIGSILTMTKEGVVEVCAQNEDGIIAASLAPTQQALYILTKNNTLLKLNAQLDLDDQVPADPDEKIVSDIASFAWKADGNYFILNVGVEAGRKAITRDTSMKIQMSPAKSDPQGGLVQSVGEKGVKQMGPLVAWQPNSAAIAGIDTLNKEGKCIKRVIFWEQNGLRHLQFQLEEVEEILELCWSPDSQLLYIQVLLNKKRQLQVYYRANYKWFLKTYVNLPIRSKWIITKKKDKSYIIIFLQFETRFILLHKKLSQQQFHTQLSQEKTQATFHYVVDGKRLHLTDFSKNIIPPPLAQKTLKFNKNIIAVSRKGLLICVLTDNQISIYDLIKQSFICKIDNFQGDQTMTPFKLLNQTTILLHKQTYNLTDNKIQRSIVNEIQQNVYLWKDTKYHYNLQQNRLTINQLVLAHNCSSFVFYHGFVLFTRTTDGMYDKLDVLPLSGSLSQSFIQNYLTYRPLAERNVERGSVILCVSKGKCIFQLPRGNLETICPKTLALYTVSKQIRTFEYKKAFEAIRTHKLDFNLLCDISPKQFIIHIKQFLLALDRVDYLNLFISMLTPTLSQQLCYMLNEEQLAFAKIEGKDLVGLLKLISKILRQINYSKFMLPIFTSDIKAGSIRKVLFEIQQLRRGEINIEVAPHIKQKSKQSGESVLQYVCWLVEPQIIYAESLLTYDLQLAAMVARCTQMDPKQFIPFLQSLKAIVDPIDMHYTVCIFLRRHSQAIRELSVGNAAQKKIALDIVREKQLFLDGIVAFKDSAEDLKQVKLILVRHLLSIQQTNEAYNILYSIGENAQAYQLAVKMFDAEKIITCLNVLKQWKRESICQSINAVLLTRQNQNNVQTAKLLEYVGRFEQAAELYLRSQKYSQAFKLTNKLSEQFKRITYLRIMQVNGSVKKNEIEKAETELRTRSQRLVIVQKGKQSGVVVQRDADQQDMYSQVSQSSRSQYTQSSTTKMRRKKDKQKSILNRKVKEGSPLEQQFLLAHIRDNLDHATDLLKQAKILIQHLTYVNAFEAAKILRDVSRSYAILVHNTNVKTAEQLQFEETHQEAKTIYAPLQKVPTDFSSFDYLF